MDDYLAMDCPLLSTLLSLLDDASFLLCHVGPVVKMVLGSQLGK